MSMKIASNAYIGPRFRRLCHLPFDHERAQSLWRIELLSVCHYYPTILLFTFTYDLEAEIEMSKVHVHLQPSEITRLSLPQRRTFPRTRTCHLPFPPSCPAAGLATFTLHLRSAPKSGTSGGGGYELCETTTATVSRST